MRICIPIGTPLDVQTNLNLGNVCLMLDTSSNGVRNGYHSYLRNAFKFWNAYRIMNTSGLLQISII